MDRNTNSIQWYESLQKKIDEYCKDRKKQGLPLQVAGCAMRLGVSRDWFNQNRHKGGELGRIIGDFYLRIEESVLDYGYRTPAGHGIVKLVLTNTFQDVYKEKQEIETTINVNYKSLTDKELQKMIEEKMNSIKHQALIDGAIELEDEDE